MIIYHEISEWCQPVRAPDNLPRSDSVGSRLQRDFSRCLVLAQFLGGVVMLASLEELYAPFYLWYIDPIQYHLDYLSSEYAFKMPNIRSIPCMWKNHAWKISFTPAVICTHRTTWTAGEGWFSLSPMVTVALLSHRFNTLSVHTPIFGRLPPTNVSTRSGSMAVIIWLVQPCLYSVRYIPLNYNPWSSIA